MDRRVQNGERTVGPEIAPEPTRALADSVREAQVKRTKKLRLTRTVVCLLGLVGLMAMGPAADVFAVETVILWIVWIYWAVLLPEHEAQSSFVTFTLPTEESVEPPPVLSERDLAIQEELRRAATTLRKCYRLSLWVGYGSLLGSALAALPLSTYFDMGALLCIPVGCLTGAFALGWIYAAGNRAARRAEVSIDRAGPTAVGAVADFLQSSDPWLHGTAFEALRRILPLVRPSDGPAIHPSQRRYLYGLLAPKVAIKRPKLTVAILKMIEQLADPGAAPFLEEMLAVLGHSRHATDREMLNAAHYALQSIGLADTALSQRGTLLSPAQAPQDPGTELLRATTSRSGAPAEELLHTVSAETARGDR